MLKHARRVAVLIIGSTVVLFGIALIVLPGPAFVVIPAGLAILATEFAWARRWLSAIGDSVEKGASKFPWTRRLLDKILVYGEKAANFLGLGGLYSRIIRKKEGQR
jgi:uncharacterized protein (TIGR02611 family)